jgi:hypothetical protein
MIVTMGMGTEAGGGTSIYYLEESIAIGMSTEIEIGIDFDSDIVIVTEED